MAWALRRKIIYTAIFIVLFSGIGYSFVSPYIDKVPSCTNYKKDGDETGMDCGGSCTRACIFEVDRISVLWSRTFRIAQGRYSAVAYLENHNSGAAISKIKYRFRFSDKDNIYIGQREGETFVPVGGKFAIFEPGIDVGNSIPVYTTLEFTEAPVWSNVSEGKLNQLKILVSNVKLETKDASTHLSATIKNDSLFTIPEVGVVALLYDEKGNVISVSRTYIEELDGEEVKDIDFTWPELLEANVIVKEIIPMYDVFSVKL